MEKSFDYSMSLQGRRLRSRRAFSWANIERSGGRGELKSLMLGNDGEERGGCRPSTASLLWFCIRVGEWLEDLIFVEGKEE